jgi:hypothetical protein
MTLADHGARITSRKYNSVHRELPEQPAGESRFPPGTFEVSLHVACLMRIRLSARMRLQVAFDANQIPPERCLLDALATADTQELISV